MLEDEACRGRAGAVLRKAGLRAFSLSPDPPYHTGEGEIRAAFGLLH